MQWGHIGWSIPSSFGYAKGAPARRVVTLLGDWSFQVTAQEVSQMVRHRLPVLIFLINNRGTPSRWRYTTGRTTTSRTGTTPRSCSASTEGTDTRSASRPPRGSSWPPRPYRRRRPTLKARRSSSASSTGTTAARTHHVGPLCGHSQREAAHKNVSTPHTHRLAVYRAIRGTARASAPPAHISAAGARTPRKRRRCCVCFVETSEGQSSAKRVRRCQRERKTRALLVYR